MRQVHEFEIRGAGVTVGKVIGVLLAGGLARRMGGGDKALLELAGRPLLAHVIDRAAPQVSTLVINANGDPARFASFGLDVVADPVEGFAGPLAGVLAGMDWAHANQPDASHIATIATDTPFFPRDFVEQLTAALEKGADMACASSAGRHHPVFGLWPVALREDLRRALVDEEIRKVDLWTARYALTAVDFAAESYDPFFNANRPEDLARAEAILAEEAA